MGGHVAEKLIIGQENITSGCSSDLAGATRIANAAIRQYGMFSDDASFIARVKKKTSDEYNTLVDKKV